MNFTFKGFEGKLHGADFKITDPEKAYILPAKLLALTVYKLLKNGGQEAKKITKSYTPVFNKGKLHSVCEEYDRIKCKELLNAGIQ